MILPYFSGERTPINDPKAKGMIFGLNLQHTRAHIYKAMLEGVGYGINQHFEIFDAKEMGTKKVMAVGGGTKTPVWLQAVSDYDLACRVKFMVVTCLIVSSMPGSFCENAQRYSKEIENDADNVEAILDGAYTAPALTDKKLLYLLTQQ